VAQTVEEAVASADRLGFPVVLKVVSPDAVHKTEVGGVLAGVGDIDGVAAGFARIRDNLERSRPGARFEGVRIVAMAPPGHDLFIGGLRDPAFGPVVVFGYGGILVELFRDVERVMCPSSQAEIEEKIARLQAAKIFAGARGRPPVDPTPFVQSILNITHLMADHSEVLEVDVNPIRLLDQGGVLALDARLRILDRE
jgi:acetyltransferase